MFIPDNDPEYPETIIVKVFHSRLEDYQNEVAVALGSHIEKLERDYKAIANIFELEDEHAIDIQVVRGAIDIAYSPGDPDARKLDSYVRLYSRKPGVFVNKDISELNNALFRVKSSVKQSAENSTASLSFTIIISPESMVGKSPGSRLPVRQIRDKRTLFLEKTPVGIWRIVNESRG